MNLILPFKTLLNIFLLAFFLSIKTVYAQCSKPTSVGNIATTDAFCPGSGEVRISNVKPFLSSPNKYLFALYSKAGIEARTWQNDSTFLHVEAGEYILKVRASCSPTSESYNYPLTIYSRDTPITFFSPIPIAAFNCCSGLISSQTFLSTSYPAPEYSLVNSLNAEELPSNYIRAKQTSRDFAQLCSGTYYLMAYDACGRYQTKEVIVAQGSRTAEISSTTISQLSCDSINLNLVFKNTVLWTQLNTNEKAWVQWPDSSIDTVQLKPISGSFSPLFDIKTSVNNLSINGASSGSFPSAWQWPVPLKVFYLDNCNTVTELSKDLANPGSLQATLEPINQVGCDTLIYKASFNFGGVGLGNSIPYQGKIASYSIDGGTIWQNLTYQNNSFQLKLKRGQNYTVQLDVCGEKVAINQNVPSLENLNPIVEIGNASGCVGDLRISTRELKSNFYVQLLTGPSASLPAALYQYNNGPQALFRQLPSGTYTYIVKDTISPACPRQTQASVTIFQRSLEVLMEAQTNTACQGTISLGFVSSEGEKSSVAKGRSIQVEVISQPVGAGLPNTFAIPWWPGTTIYPLELNSAIPGNYQFKIIDSTGIDCPREALTSINIPDQAVLNLDIDYQTDCNRDVTIIAKGLHHKINTNGELVSRTLGAGPWNLELRDSLGNSPTIYKTTVIDYTNRTTKVIFRNIPLRTYTIRSSMPYKSCVFQKTAVLGNIPIALADTRILSICDDGSGKTVTTQAFGGAGTYSYSLFNGSISDNNLIDGPQTSGIFEEVTAGTSYVVTVTDQCGSGAQRTVSQTESNYYLSSSADKYCPGDNMTLSMTYVSGATYVWKKNNAIIPNQTSYQLIVSNLQSGVDDGTYSVEMTLNNCSVASNKLKIAVNCMPLPVQLSVFNASVVENKVALVWETTSESKFSGFVIERSFDLKHWESIGFIPSKSRNHEGVNTMEYNFEDYELLAENQYYRLKNLDLDGSYSHSNIRSVNLKGINTEFVVYPNPATNTLTVTQLRQGTSISLLDLKGNTIHPRKLDEKQEGKQSFDVSDLPPGIYQVKISEGQRTVATQKLAIVH